LNTLSRRAITGAIASLSAAGALPGMALAAKPAPPVINPPAPAKPPAPPLEVVALDDGTQLHYVTDGLGAAVIFVHGSLSDYTYWNDQFLPFAERYRFFAYSRRYNWPNDNPPLKRGYSAITDAADLAGFITKLNLGPAHIVGHSYGALTALILAIQRPDLIHTLTLAEPPAVTLLKQLPPDQAKAGAALYADIEKNMVAPMRAAFTKGKRDVGVAAFINYVHADPGAWDKFTDAQKAETLKDAHEWDVMLPTGVLFPDFTTAQVAAIKTPTLILSGAKSYPFLGTIDAEIARLLPSAKHIVFPNATHQMWLEEPDLCRAAVVQLIDAKH
jgi:pimeloyl-ACP methyl ester carboxylesterase